MILHFGPDLIGSAIRNVGGTPDPPESGLGEPDAVGVEAVVGEVEHDDGVVAGAAARPAVVGDEFVGVVDVVDLDVASAEACGDARGVAA